MEKCSGYYVISNKMKGKFYKTVVRLAMLSEHWTFQHILKRSVAEMQMVKTDVLYMRLDKIKIDHISLKVHVTHIEGKMKGCLRWFGHILC